MSIMDELKKLTRPYDDDGTMVDDELDDMDTGLDDAAFTRSAAPQSQPTPQPQPAPQPIQSQTANPITMGGMNMGGMGRHEQRASAQLRKSHGPELWSKPFQVPRGAGCSYLLGF